MEAVAPHARLAYRARQGEQLRDLRLVAVERGVEAGDLRQVRQPPAHDADRLEVVRLVKRRERHERFELLPGPSASIATGRENVHARRARPGGRRPRAVVAPMLARARRRGASSACSCPKRSVARPSALRRHARARSVADQRIGASCRAPRTGRGRCGAARRCRSAFEQLELQARRPRVEDEKDRSSWLRPPAGRASRAAPRRPARPRRRTRGG